MFSLYPGKWLKFNTSEYTESLSANQKPGNLKFSAPFNKMKQKSKVSTVNIQINRLVLKVFNFKVYSSGNETSKS